MRHRAICGALALVVSAGCAAMASSALADDSPPVGALTIGPAQEVSGTQPAVPTPARPPGVFINRPTTSMSSYVAHRVRSGEAIATRLGPQRGIEVLPSRRMGAPQHPHGHFGQRQGNASGAR